PRHRARCTHLQTQPGRIQPIDSSQLAARFEEAFLSWEPQHGCSHQYQLLVAGCPEQPEQVPIGPG
ncbi:hypothetical protein OMF50_09005, partial [Bordetella pertussis]